MPPAEIQHPDPGPILPVFAWCEGYRYYVIIHSKSADIFVISREPSTVPEMQGYYVCAAVLRMTREQAPHALDDFWLDPNVTVIDCRPYHKVKRRCDMVEPEPPKNA